MYVVPLWLVEAVVVVVTESIHIHIQVKGISMERTFQEISTT